MEKENNLHRQSMARPPSNMSAPKASLFPIMLHADAPIFFFQRCPRQSGIRSITCSLQGNSRDKTEQHCAVQKTTGLKWLQSLCQPSPVNESDTSRYYVLQVALSPEWESCKVRVFVFIMRCTLGKAARVRTTGGFGSGVETGQKKKTTTMPTSWRLGAYRGGTRGGMLSDGVPRTGRLLPRGHGRHVTVSSSLTAACSDMLPGFCK